MKTKEELIALKNELETLNQKLLSLSAEELALVTGGNDGTTIMGDKDDFWQYSGTYDAMPQVR